MPTGSGALEAHVDTASFRDLFSRSSQVEAKLRTALRRNIRRAGQELADQVRSEALLPGAGVEQKRILRRSRFVAGSGRSTGLRAGIAAGVKVQVMTGASREGVRIVSTGPLAQAWEAQRGWRHPAFGNREAWITQKGHPYFRKTVWAGRDKVRSAVEDAMAEAVASLKGNS